MRLALIALVALAGVSATILAAARLWRASGTGAPREQLVGYMAIMVGASALSLLVLRLL